MNRGLRAYNGQNKLAQWVQIVSECRESGMSVRQWCQEHGINISSYYKWQRKVYAMVQAQQEVQFAEVTPVQAVCTDRVAVTIRIHGMEADIHSGADAARTGRLLVLLRVFCHEKNAGSERRTEIVLEDPSAGASDWRGTGGLPFLRAGRADEEGADGADAAGL